MYMVFLKMSIKSCPWRIFNNQEKSASDVILKKKKKKEKGPNTTIIIMLKNMLIRSLQEIWQNIDRDYLCIFPSWHFPL